MICEICEYLQTGDGEPSRDQFFCIAAQKKIQDPHKKQRWCPKTLKKRQDTTIQTNYEEMKFIDRLSQEQLIGYIAGTQLRDPGKTDFDIPFILTYARSKLQ